MSWLTLLRGKVQFLIPAKFGLISHPKPASLTNIQIGELDTQKIGTIRFDPPDYEFNLTSKAIKNELINLRKINFKLH